MSLEIVQIVPKLPPTISGVGDYAYLLARQLRAAHDIHTRFVLCDPYWRGENDLDGFRVDRVTALRADELRTRLCTPGMPETVLVQYSGYGYEKRGCPVWLVRALESWKRHGGNRRLVVMFHELFAFGPPWRSSFWVHPVQQWLTTVIAKLADRCITNLERYNDWLSRRMGRYAKSVVTIPVFSNVGETSEVSQLTTRPPNMVIFGGARWLKSLLEEHAEVTLNCCRTLGLQKIITIGSPVGTAPASLPIPITEHGFPDRYQVANIIQSSRVGMMDYFPGHLGKSGVFAAYSALGVLPVLPHLNESDRDGCRAGKNYLVPDHIRTSMPYEGLQQIADDAWRWYQAHSLSRTAAAYVELLKG